MVEFRLVDVARVDFLDYDQAKEVQTEVRLIGYLNTCSTQT